MKKILFITMNYSPSNVPDAKRVSGFVNNLVNKGYDVEVITSTFGSQGESPIRVTSVNTKGEDSNGMFKRLIKHTSFLMGTNKIIRSKRKAGENFDYVFATSPALFNLLAGVYAKKKFNSILISDLRDVWPDVFEQTGIMSKKSPIYIFFDIIASYCYKKSDYITVVTPGKYKLLRAKKNMNPDKVIYLSNGFNASVLNVKDDHEFLENFDMSKKKVVYCGKIGLAQNLQNLVKIAQLDESKNIDFYIMGTGNQLESILEYIESNNVGNVYYLGNRNEREVITALRHADLAYVSLSNSKLIDSIPTKLYESLVSGCPVLLSAKGDSVDLLMKTGMGLASDPGDYESMRNNFKYIFENHEEFTKNREGAYKFLVDNFSRDEVSKKLVEIME